MKLSAVGFAALLIASGLAKVPDELENAFQGLKDAAAKKDTAQVKKLAVQVFTDAGKFISSPEPQSDEEKSTWKADVQYAKQMQDYTEYALYAAAIGAPPAAVVDLISTLEQQTPKSKYLDQAYSMYLYALSQTGAASKIIPVAEKGIANFPNNEDLLIVLADGALSHKQNDRALSYSERLITVLSKHGTPEGMNPADWQKKRDAALGRANWIAGIVHADKQQYALADKNLRAALPYIKGNDVMVAAALFNLGLANYQLGKQTLNKARVLEAVKFSQEAAAIKGPYQQQAWRNATVMQTEAGKMR